MIRFVNTIFAGMALGYGLAGCSLLLMRVVK